MSFEMQQQAVHQLSCSHMALSSEAIKHVGLYEYMMYTVSKKKETKTLSVITATKLGRFQ